MNSPTQPGDANSRTVDAPSPDEKTGLIGRAHQLLSYLEGLHRLRHPRNLDAIPPEIVLAPSLPDHEAVRLHPEDGVFLEVQRVDPPELIPIPEPLTDRVEWKDVQAQPKLRQRADTGSNDHSTDPLAEPFDDWLNETWTPWRERIQPTLDARKLFLTLYDMRLAAERELATHEVVWTHGISIGTASDGSQVRLPLFVYPVRYELDDQTGHLRVEASGAARLEIDSFERVIDTFDLVKQIERELVAEPEPGQESADDQSWNSRLGETEVLERLSKVIADAEFLGLAASLPRATDRWQFVDIEGLFHRRRPVQYEAYFRALDEALDDGYLPDTWSAILADEPTTAPISERVASTDKTWASLDQRIYSPLPLNKQQQKIINRIAHNAGVTVQGPPGTGKSYAIASLTSHFLTHGLRVLICAEKPQPLQVIRDKMPKELQELCVAVLGDDRAASQQLDASINAITARVNAVDVRDDQSRLEEIDGRLDQVRRLLAELRNQELEVRSTEQRTVTVGDKEFRPAQAAKHLVANRTDGWIADDIALETSLPLSVDEVTELVSLTGQLAPEDRSNHGPVLCGLDQLTSGAKLDQYWQQLDAAALRVSSVASDIDLDAVNVAGRDPLKVLLSNTQQHRERVAWASNTQWSTIQNAISVSAAQRERWQQIVTELNNDADGAMKLNMQLAAHHIEYPLDLDGKDPGPLLAELRQRFDGGKGLPRVGGGELKKLVAAITIDGHQPASTADLDLLNLAMSRDQLRRRLTNRWNQELGALGFAPLDPNRPEDLYQTTHQPSLEVLVSLPTQSASLADAIGPLLKSPASFDNAEGLDRVVHLLKEADALFHRQELATQLDRFVGTIAHLSTTGHATTRQLNEALLKHDAVAWDTAAEEIRRLHQLDQLLTRHAELTSRFGATAPILAQTYRSDTPSFDASQIEAAWQWRQLRRWVDEILSMGDLSDISNRISEAEQEQQRLLTELVSQKAWLEMAKRTTGAHRSALETWAQAMSRIGKGTGKHAPRHRLTAQKAMRSAQDAVPVWIMSIAQAIDSFRPGEDAAFDIVIVDEASQAPLDTIAVLGLGQRVLVVGDDKQISPTVITDETAADLLRQQHLGQVPDSEGFDIRTSLYDTASRRFPGVIQLREHFRCLPEIIAFSNDLSYEGRVDPLREHHTNSDWQPVRAIRLKNGYRDGLENPAERDAVIAQVVQLLDDPAFGKGPAYPDGATVGIMAMIGSAQAKAIQSLLIETVPIDEIENRRIRVGSPYEFQGDERDVIIISMVDAINEDGRPTGQAATSKLQQQRYNVAASRARDQMIVIHSFDPAQMSEPDLRRRLVSFAQSPKRHSEITSDLRESCESKFERDILERLLKLGLRVDAQYPVAGYRIDFTLTDLSDRRVAIECDGDSFHGIDQLRADTDRQRILERMGWRFARIRASEFYNDEDGSFAKLVGRVRDHGLQVDQALAGPRLS